MSSQKHIQDELKGLGSNLPFYNNQPFSVPDGYFEGLATALLAKVKGSKVSSEAELGELSPLLAGIPKIMPYSVPLSYFQTNIKEVSGLIHETESSVLNKIGKELLYSVPSNYFDNLPQEVLVQVTKPISRVVPLFARTWMKVASAAVVAGALFVAGLQLFSSKSELDTTARNQTDTTKNLVARNEQPVIKEFRQASTKELEEFIETVQVNPVSPPEKGIQNSEKEVEELLKDISIGEMETFLSAIPTDDDLLITN